ncbi:ATP-dependent DNA ligase [Anaeromyxobacter paludicola]|uniref:DNA ligase (ATP) n=1 Tax=Anaeromyxobacter paludicola TaxID=2918171 RepID=A0ABM7XF59_9BACT|nr:ATP-dependent DNA ligase [Anaeromyxobacter paludicola]BDG10534.1 ATP-dependent DNA ligase [Anaeromyxobacter paludicola]
MDWPPLALPIQPPFPPMEARLEDDLPAGEGWQLEPKWDGFRCLAYRDGAEVALQSKAGQPLGRYFPELVQALGTLPAPRFILDGEIVVPVAEGFSFEDLLQRIHPAESRIRRLSRERPAALLVFDLLADERGRLLADEPLSARRAALERFAAAFLGDGPVRLSPVARDREEALGWLSGRAGVDGVVAKRAAAPYRGGERDMVKVKPERTADCVVGGFRWAAKGREVGSLLLGLYRDDGRLDHVGHCSGFDAATRRAFTATLPALASNGPGTGFSGTAPGGPSRWARGRSTEWVAVRPELVVEVAFRHVSGGRFRHGTRLVRLRPDKRPDQCRLEQLGAAGRAELEPPGADP